MNAAVPTALAPFRIRSFRYQWPADLATSWAFEMETLILGWYVLVETGSVLMLTVFASLQYIGTLLAPLFGVAADRIGHGNLLSAMRATYALLALSLMALVYAGALTPFPLFVIAALMGLVRPSDMGMRAALVGDTMPAQQLMGAMGVQRTTSDSARVMGALTGAALVATLGMGPAYSVIVSLYAASFFLTFKVARMRRARTASAAKAETAASPWRDLKAAAAYVWHTPLLLGTMCLAFLANLFAYPLINSMMPYVAKEIYRTDQTGLGYLVASFAFGALLGSIFLSRRSSAASAGRMMLVSSAVWYSMIFVFAHTAHFGTALVVLMIAGFAQSLAMVPMAAILLRNSEVRFRGRLMGLRMLAIYGMPLGLLAAGPLVTHYGYPVTASLYCVLGLVLTGLIAARWRPELWRREAPSNTR